MILRSFEIWQISESSPRLSFETIITHSERFGIWGMPMGLECIESAMRYRTTAVSFSTNVKTFSIHLYTLTTWDMLPAVKEMDVQKRLDGLQLLQIIKARPTENLALCNHKKT